MGKLVHVLVGSLRDHERALHLVMSVLSLGLANALLVALPLELVHLLHALLILELLDLLAEQLLIFFSGSTFAFNLCQ